MAADVGSGGLRTSPHVPLAWAGLILTFATSIVGSGFNPMSIPFALWSAMPYVGLWMVGRHSRSPWPVLGAGAAALAAEVGIRAAVFLFPRGSTAAIALVFSPVYIGAIVMPLGAAAGWVLGRLWRWHVAGRLAALILGPAVLGLLALGLARPDLFPTTVLARRALRERVGPPRVVVGAGTFRSVQVSSRSAWSVAGAFDGVPGDELAIVDQAGADLIDTTTLDVTSRIPFDAAPGQLWGAFSTLVRLPAGTMAVAQTGGGFSRTRLQALDGAQLWEYHPDPKLPPDAMRPADLDRDGQVEFYAASGEAMVRLDADGREVWRQPTAMASLVAMLPASDDAPAWVVGVEYGRRLIVWDAAGRVVGERPITSERTPMAAVDVFAGRYLIEGGRSVRGFTLDGVFVFETPLGDFTASDVVGVRLGAAERPSMLIVGSTDRDTSLYRLLIVAADGRVVYDEVLDEYPRATVARRVDGTDAVFIHTGDGLRLLTNQ